MLPIWLTENLLSEVYLLLMSRSKLLLPIIIYVWILQLTMYNLQAKSKKIR